MKRTLPGEIMKTTAIVRALLVALMSCCAPSFAQGPVIPILTNIGGGSISSTTYSCKEMVESINALRHLGKDQALKVLKSDLKENKDEIKTMCICRVLFTNTNGWKPIAGVDMYREMVHTNVLEQFPLFPMALIDGVPFFIYRGFNFDGRLAEGAGEDLQLCEGFALIPGDLPGGDYKKAAYKLLQSESFLKLYKVPNYADSVYTKDLMTEILWEAGATNVPPPAYTDPDAPVAN
jgi:hypothetical protein